MFSSVQNSSFCCAIPAQSETAGLLGAHTWNVRSPPKVEVQTGPLPSTIAPRPASRPRRPANPAKRPPTSIPWGYEIAAGSRRSLLTPLGGCARRSARQSKTPIGEADAAVGSIAVVGVERGAAKQQLIGWSPKNRAIGAEDLQGFTASWPALRRPSTRLGGSSARKTSGAKSPYFVGLCGAAAWMAGTSPAMTTPPGRGAGI